MTQVDEYQTLFASQQVLSIAHRIGRRLVNFYQKFSLLFLHHININRLQPVYSQSINVQLKALVYNKTEQDGPICSNLITKYYRCQDCEKVGGSAGGPCICEDCFKLGQHPGHNFRVVKISSQGSAVCDCGDERILDKRFFCKRHKGESGLAHSVKINQEDEEIFIRQMQFLLYIFVRLRAIVKGQLDQQKKKDIFGVQIINKMEQFISKSYPNQNIIASFFTSTFRFPYPQLLQEYQGKNMLYIMFRCAKISDFIDRLCLKLLLPLYCVKRVREVTLIEFFKYSGSTQTYLNIGCSISRIAFQYMNAGNQIQALLEDHKIMPLAINYQFSDFKQKSLAFIRLFVNYKTILAIKNAERIMFLMLKQINICQLSNFCTSKEERLNRTAILLVQIQYFKLLSEFIKLFMQSQYKQQVLKKIVLQTYRHLKQKKQSLSLSVQRTFAFALFALLHCSPESIYDMQQQYLLQLLGQQSVQVVVKTAKQLIKKSLHIIKIDNFNQYKKTILTEMETVGLNKVMVSIDHLYTRLLLMTLIRLQMPTFGEMIEPFSQFMDARQKAMTALYELFESDEISKSEETMSVMMYEICLMVSNFLFLSQSSISEVIVSEFLGVRREHETMQVYRMLVYVYPDATVKEFKKLAEKYLRSPVILEKFIKEEYAGYKQAVKGSQVPENSFNLSYNSFYVTPGSFKEYRAFYYVKLSDPRYTELSRLVFGVQTIAYIERIFSWFLDIYSKSFRENEVAATRNVLLVLFQTLVVLWGQTRRQIIKKLIQEVIAGRLLEREGSNDYYRQVVEMYQEGERRVQLLAGVGQGETGSLAARRLKEQGRLKRQQKMKQIKRTQTQVLERVLSSDGPEQPHDQQQRECIVCKGDSRRNKLNYICYFRYSNFMSQHLLDINYPIILISTCGHLIHKECLDREFEQRLTREGILQYQCSLCKANSNLLVPLMEGSLSNLELKGFLAKIQLLQVINKMDNPAKGIYIQQLAEQKQPLARCIISLVYQIYGYTICYPKYLVKKILPVLKEMKRFMRFLGVERAAWEEAQIYFRKFHGMPSYALIDFIYTTLKNVVERDVEEPFFTKEMADSLRLFEERRGRESMERQHEQSRSMQIHQKQRHKQLICMLFDQLQGRTQLFTEYSASLVRGKTEHRQVFKLPNDLHQLNKNVGFCPQCDSKTSKIAICYLCSDKFCQDCRRSMEEHCQTMHLGNTAFIRVERGQCVYFLDKHSVSSCFLYLDYVGDEVKANETFPKKGRYTLSNERSNALMEDVIDDQIPFRVFEKMEALSRERCDIQ